MNKYNAIKTQLDGYTFDSKAEARRYAELRLAWNNGDIDELLVHERYPLSVNGHLICEYEADFTYKDNGKLIVEDVKGVKTDVYRLKKKLMRAIHGIEILETS